MSTPLWIEAMPGQERAGRNAANSSNFLRIGGIIHVGSLRG
jgi:hypothetical protein